MAKLALLLQLLLSLALGGFISRLKVLGAPLLQLLAALAFAPGTWRSLLPQEGIGGLRRFVRVSALASLMLLQIGHVAFLARRMPFLEGREAHREMSWPDADRAELADWLNRHLRDEGEVLVTSMPLSAELRLSTPFRFAIHPQFEQRALRDRVQEIYKFYQCTPAEEMAEVLRRYNSSIIVLEYKRCDFSPFLLDERPDLNCEKGQRPWKDLFCPVAHVSPLFSLLFANAGFSVHRLLPRSTAAPQPAKLRRLEDMEVWRPMLQSCLRDAPADCGARVADLAAMLHSKLNQPKVADGLFAWVRENAPGDGVARYLMAHHVDYNLGRPQDAGGGYAQAAGLAPNNALVLREYLMWLDLEAKDNRTLESILRPRRFSKGQRLSLLELGDVALACEASVPAWELFRDLDWAEELWSLALAKGMGSSCVKNNWPLHNGGRELEADVGQWGKFLSSFWHRRLRSEFVTSTGNGARFRDRARDWRLGPRPS